jgi:serine protease
MIRRAPILAAVALLATAIAAAPARAATGISPAREFAPGQVMLKLRGQRRGRTVDLPAGVGVRQAARALRRSPRVAYAVPNYIATASAANVSLPPFVPNDPGALVGRLVPGRWIHRQWNFLPWSGDGVSALPTSPGGIDAPGAWANLIAAGHPGAKGITVAVLDTGIAYRDYRAGNTQFLRSPDFAPSQFVRGYDLIKNDPFPLDRNGHGTHVAGTIAEGTDNGIGLAGIAYGAKLMPVRVLNKYGEGLASRIAKGIRFAAAHGADVINMSFNFACHEKVPTVNAALRQAYEKGIVTVASIGNRRAENCVSPPATSPHVIGVGGTTEGGCLGKYSLTGAGVDIVAPGGGVPVAGCPSVFDGPIYQVTLRSPSTALFGEPDRYVGTSMAAAHVSGVAAMVLASGVLDKNLPPEDKVNAAYRQLRATARDLGLPSEREGAGLIDAGKATERLP